MEKVSIMENCPSVSENGVSFDHDQNGKLSFGVIDDGNSSVSEFQLDLLAADLEEVVRLQDLEQVRSLLAEGANPDGRIGSSEILDWHNANHTKAEKMEKSTNIIHKSNGETIVTDGVKDKSITSHGEVEVKVVGDVSSGSNANPSEEFSSSITQKAVTKASSSSIISKESSSSSTIIKPSSSSSSTAAKESSSSFTARSPNKDDRRLDRNHPPLVTAIQNGDLAIVQCLLEGKANPNFSGWNSETAISGAPNSKYPSSGLTFSLTPLTLATRLALDKNRHDIVECLLAFSADPNPPPLNIPLSKNWDDHPVICQVCLSTGGDLPMVRMLLDAQVDPNTLSNETRLLSMAHKIVGSANRSSWPRQLPLLSMSIVSGPPGPLRVHPSHPDPSHTMNENFSQKFQLVQLLVESQANVNLKTEYGESVLYFAAKRRHVDVVKYLLDQGADRTVKCHGVSENGKILPAKGDTIRPSEVGNPQIANLLWDYGVEM